MSTNFSFILASFIKWDLFFFNKKVSVNCKKTNMRGAWSKFAQSSDATNSPFSEAEWKYNLRWTLRSTARALASHTLHYTFNYIQLNVLHKNGLKVLYQQLL